MRKIAMPYKAILPALCLGVVLCFLQFSAFGQVLGLPPAHGAAVTGAASGSTEVSNFDKNFRYTEFAIPTAAAFSIMNADPSLVTMPGVVRDFKVDWSFRTYRLSPNLALEATPIWSFFYDRPGYKAYQKAPFLMRRLSTLNISLGTIQFDTIKQVAWAVKINLFSRRDPFANPEIMDEGLKDIMPLRDTLIAQIGRLRYRADTARTEAEEFAYEWQAFQLEQQLQGYETQLKERSNQIRNVYFRRFWNSASVDLAFGKSYRFFNENLDSVRLNTKGIGVWVTGGVGLGRKWFVSGIVKYLQYSEKEYGFQRGMNVRYGTVRFHFFAEGVYEGGKLMKKTDAASDSLSLVSAKTLSFGYGGAFRIGPTVLLSFGIRTIYNHNMSLESVLPVANIACLMR